MSGHLLWQLRTSDLREERREIAFHIIGNLDKNGYLDIELSEIAAAEKTTLEVVEEVLSEVQTFDPAGIACRDLRECLPVSYTHLRANESREDRVSHILL